MGRFNLPLLVLFVVVTIVVAAGLLAWSDLATWAALLLAPIASYAGIFALSQIIDLVESLRPTKVGRPQAAELADPELPQTPIDIPIVPAGLSCPSCGSDDLAAIEYGLPAMTERLEKAIAERRLTLGGCCPWDGAPLWACNDCRHQFGELRAREGG